MEGLLGRTAARYERLSESELAALVQSLPQRPLLAGEKDVRLSLAGAQDKLPVFYDGKAVSLPVNGAPINYILKPPISGYAETVPNEVFSMKLAKAMGLTVPEVSIHLCGDTPLCMVQRFDRKMWVNNKVVNKGDLESSFPVAEILGGNNRVVNGQCLLVPF